MATGYVVAKQGARIVDIVPNIREIDDDNMHGDRSVFGVNLKMADFFVTDEKLELKLDDVFPEGHTNVADKYLKKEPQAEVHNNIAALLIESAADKQKIASLESMVGNLLIGVASLKGGQ
ncbi:hypothetical protein ABID47_005811 [Paenibacillus favisporus]|uniref:Uncharacterized protein n=1 Tax=Paenibacillus favisporus TaxID=221028 RepID=A0ABV2FBN0_9BACL